MAYDPDYHREYYLRNKEKYKYNPAKREQNRLAQRRWRFEDRERYMLSAAKYRAKRLGIDFNLEPEDIVIPENCPILGIPLAFTEGKQNNGTPALDRVDNSKGYIKGNVEVISHKANRMKSDMSFDDIGRLYDYVKDRKKLA